jgi:hypothetical protein
VNPNPPGGDTPEEKEILQDFEMTQLDRRETTEGTAATTSNCRLWTVPKTAAYLGLSEYSVRRMVRQGQLPTRQVASRKLIPVALLRGWLGRQVSLDQSAATPGAKDV